MKKAGITMLFLFLLAWPGILFSQTALHKRAKLTVCDTANFSIHGSHLRLWQGESYRYHGIMANFNSIVNIVNQEIYPYFIVIELNSFYETAKIKNDSLGVVKGEICYHVKKPNEVVFFARGIYHFKLKIPIKIFGIKLGDKNFEGDMPGEVVLRIIYHQSNDVVVSNFDYYVRPESQVLNSLAKVFKKIDKINDNIDKKSRQIFSITLQAAEKIIKGECDSY